MDNQRHPHRNAPFPSSLQLARRLLKGEGTPHEDDVAQSARLQRTCERVTESLAVAMGTDGSAALLTRALARAEPHHPALKDMRRTRDGIVTFDGVHASVAVHGAAAVTEATEALLAALIEVLTRIIGEDMTIRLMETQVPPAKTNGGAPTT